MAINILALQLSNMFLHLIELMKQQNCSCLDFHFQKYHLVKGLAILNLLDNKFRLHI